MTFPSKSHITFLSLIFLLKCQLSKSIALNAIFNMYFLLLKRNFAFYLPRKRYTVLFSEAKPIPTFIPSGTLPLMLLSLSRAVSTTQRLSLTSPILLYSPVCSSHLQLFGRHSGTAHCSDILVLKETFNSSAKRHQGVHF